MTDNPQPFRARTRNGQAELVEAIIELNNMGDDWDAQHIGELVADWHNKQTERWFQVLIDEVGYEKAVAYKEAMKHG